MKFPSSEIYWHIADSGYMSIKDMALFESALTNLACRSALNLTVPPARKASWPRRLLSGLFLCRTNSNEMIEDSQNVTDKYPYEKHVHLRKDLDVDLSSADFESWCVKRRLILPHIRLSGYDPCNLQSFVQDQGTSIGNSNRNSQVPSTRNIPSSKAWDLLNHVEYLQIWGSDIRCDKLLPRLGKLQGITYVNGSPQRNDEINAIVDYFTNAYSPSSSTLSNLSLVTTCMSSNTFFSVIDSMKTITTLELLKAGLLNDSLIATIAKTWANLKSITLRDSPISDEALTHFCHSKISFTEVSLRSCRNITSLGLRDFLSNSSTTLISLSIRDMSVEEDDILPIVEKYPELESFSISSNDYSDKIMTTIASSCPKLKKLELLSFCNITNEGVVAMVLGCKKIENLYISSELYRSSLMAVAEAYKETLRQVSYRKKKAAFGLGMQGESDASLFADCRYKVNVQTLK